MKTVPIVRQGTFVFCAEFEQDADDTEIDHLNVYIDGFLRAIDKQMFPYSTLQLHEEIENESPNRVFRKIKAVLCEHALTVFSGMMTQFHNSIAFLKSIDFYEVTNPSMPLLGAHAKLPAFDKEETRYLSMDITYANITPGLEIEITLAMPVKTQIRDEYISDLRAWHQLLQGGYSVSDTRGESSASYCEVRFLLPNKIRYVTDAWYASENCFIPLLNLIRHWQQDIDVLSIKIETF